jgi:hypothetical protein
VVTVTSLARMATACIRCSRANSRNGALGEITLVRELSDAALAVAGSLATDTRDDLREVQTRLTEETLTTYLRTELLYDLPSIELDAAALALPIKARSPVLSEIGDIRESSFEVKARLEGQEAAVEVEAVYDMTILVDTAPEADLGPAFVEIANEDEVRVWQATKPVRFTALLTVDQYDRPTGGDITSIRAMDDDPGHAARRAALRGLSRLGGLPPEVLRAARESMGFRLPPETLAALGKWSGFRGLPPETLQAFGKLSRFRLPPEVFGKWSGLRGLSPEVRKAFWRIEDQGGQEASDPDNIESRDQPADDPEERDEDGHPDEQG